MKRLNTIFTNFIYEEFCNFDLDEIEKFCLQEKEKTSSLVRSNIGGFHSADYYEDTVKNTPFELIHEKLNSTTHELCQNFEIDSEIKMSNLWFIFNKPGDHNLPHIHPFSVFSGAFYVKAPKDCGFLSFKNPNATIPYYIFDDRVKNFNHFNGSTWRIEPEPNKLVIFPSWLEHYVLPNRSEEERLVLSFNYVWKNNGT